MRRLVIPTRLLQQILEHCLDEKPYEACGILSGKDGQVQRAYATDNAKHSPVYFEVDRSQQEQVLRQIAEDGQELVGIYHSHPTSFAIPSANDVRLAVHYPEAIRVIISLHGPIQVKAYLIENSAAREIEVAGLADADGEWHDLRGSAART